MEVVSGRLKNYYKANRGRDVVGLSVMKFDDTSESHNRAYIRFWTTQTTRMAHDLLIIASVRAFTCCHISST
jgi:hypothetical protein